MNGRSTASFIIVAALTAVVAISGTYLWANQKTINQQNIIAERDQQISTLQTQLATTQTESSVGQAITTDRIDTTKAFCNTKANSGTRVYSILLIEADNTASFVRCGMGATDTDDTVPGGGYVIIGKNTQSQWQELYVGQDVPNTLTTTDGVPSSLIN